MRQIIVYFCNPDLCIISFCFQMQNLLIENKQYQLINTAYDTADNKLQNCANDSLFLASRIFVNKALSATKVLKKSN